MKLDSPDLSKTYLIAVSGGVDSMVLAHCFKSLCCRFRIAHCNFQLRGIEADLDTKLVKKWCSENNIECDTRHFHTTAYAAEHKLSIQVAARQLRYTFFNEIMSNHQIDYLVTAHHRDDNIETVLFHFFRGTGISGLCGIPSGNHSIIRPLLHVSKQDIETYAYEHNVPFRLDESNLKQEYTRNKLRLAIIPELKQMFPSFEQNMVHNIERLSEVNELYMQQIELYKKKLLEPRGKDFYIPLLKLKYITPLQTVLYELIKPFGFSSDQVPEVIQLMHGHTGSYIQSKEYRIIKNRNFFIITSAVSTESEQILIQQETKEIQTNSFSLSIKSSLASDYVLKKESSICALDASLLVWPLVLRKWKQGDYMYPFGMQKKKKVSKILIDAKIPLHEKEQIWVLESDKKIVWVLGIKTDNRFRITSHTKEVVELHLK